MTDATINITDETPEDINSNTEEHPIAVAINHGVHKVLDIQQCAEQFIPAAWEYHNRKADELDKLFNEIDNIIELAKTQQEEVQAASLISKAVREANRLSTSDLAETLEKSLYINLFSIFDKFTGDLITELFNRKNDLYKNIQREFKLSELIDANSIDEVKKLALEKEIETLKRKSYSEQFKDLENRFGVSLTKFKSWPNFVEAAQKRNLLVHCDGIISEQYIKACQAIEYKHKKTPVLGEKVELGPNIFIPTTWTIIEVITMLGQTLWRRLLPDEIEDADNHLHRLIYDFLEMEKWDEAIKLSKFAIGLPKHSSDQISKINSINYAIALNQINQTDAAKNVVNKIDWSSSIYDFRIAHAVINNDKNAAKNFMIRLGKRGELINEEAYHTWPLFKDFRTSKEFMDAYLEIYGYPYISKASELSEISKVELQEQHMPNTETKR